jgi:hypothetical protein
MTPDFTIHLDGAGAAWSAWLPSIAGLVGALLGAGISIASTFGLEAWRDRRTARRMALAVASEVEAAVKLVGFRRYIPDLDDMIAMMVRGQGGGYTFKMGEGYLPVSNAAADGSTNLPQHIFFKLAEMLTLIRAVKTDLDDLSDADSALHNTGISVYVQLRVLLGEAIAVAIDLVNDIDGYYSTGATRTWVTAQWDLAVLRRPLHIPSASGASPPPAASPPTGNNSPS